MHSRAGTVDKETQTHLLLESSLSHEDPVGDILGVCIFPYPLAPLGMPPFHREERVFFLVDGIMLLLRLAKAFLAKTLLSCLAQLWVPGEGTQRYDLRD